MSKLIGRGMSMKAGNQHTFESSPKDSLETRGITLGH